MTATATKITDQAIDDYFGALFGAPATAAPEPGKRSGCLVCDLQALRAHRDYAICIHCAADATTAAARLDGRERTVLRIGEKANDAYHAAYAAMAEGERSRWDKFCAARLAVERAGRHAGTADAETRLGVARMLEALKRKDQRIPPTLQAMYEAGEALYWANAEVAAHGVRIARAREELDACMNALSREEAAA